MTNVTDVRRLKEDFGDLLVSHKKGRSQEDIAARYRDDPVGFIREVLKGDPWEAQVRMAEAARDHQLVLVQSCNSAGKDWLAARLALWWVYARGGLVLITGPTERQVREIVMGEVRRAWTGADLPGELYSMALRLTAAEHSGILAFSSDDPSRLTGLHAPRVMVIITEGQGVPDFTYEAALAELRERVDEFITERHDRGGAIRDVALARVLSLHSDLHREIEALAAVDSLHKAAAAHPLLERRASADAAVTDLSKSLGAGDAALGLRLVAKHFPKLHARWLGLPS